MDGSKKELGCSRGLNDKITYGEGQGKGLAKKHSQMTCMLVLIQYYCV